MQRETKINPKPSDLHAVKKMAMKQPGISLGKFHVQFWHINQQCFI